MTEREPRAWGRTGDLVRTYKAVNDPNAPPWSIKFVGGIAAFAVLLAAAGALWYAGSERSSEPPAAAAATVEEHRDGSVTSYVGFPPGSPVDAAQVEAAYAAWEAANPGVTVLQKEPLLHQGRLVGYHVTHR